MSANRRNKAPLATVNTDYTNTARTETDAALNAGEAIASLKLSGEVHTLNGGRPYRINEDGKVESLEGFLLQPVMRRGDVAVYDAESFVEYVNRFQTDCSVIFADKARATFTSVLDYHEPTVADGGAAGWGRHRVYLTLRATRAWETWVKVSGSPMNQAVFAQHLEDNLPDIAEPAGALIVEIVRTLEARKNIVFESSIRENDGSHRFIFSEEVQGTARRGQLPVPDVFMLVLQPFEGSDKYPVQARLRYRLEGGGKLSLWFDLVRVQDVLEDAFGKELTRIEVGVEEPTIFNGPAPARLTVE